MLLDDEFLRAYEHGVVIECCDHLKRRFYPRIFAYTADYPEKYVLLVDFPKNCLSHKNLGSFSLAYATWGHFPVLDASHPKIFATNWELKVTITGEHESPG